MDPSGRPPDASAAFARTAAPGPWWAGSRARLSALLTCLVLALLGLLHDRAGVFSSAGEPSPSWRRCIPLVPPLATVDFPGLYSLRESLLGVMAPLNRVRYAAGTVSTEVAWSDNSPVRLRSSRLEGGLWPASYEMRTWAGGGEDIVVDVFQFATAGQARSFFEQAASARCRQAATEREASRPPRARNLVWVNPDGPTQEDAYVVRGPRVYRVGEVRSERQPAGVEQQAGVSRVDTLACALPGAACPAQAGASVKLGGLLRRPRLPSHAPGRPAR
jgi:hypothetical protein